MIILDLGCSISDLIHIRKKTRHCETSYTSFLAMTRGENNRMSRELTKSEIEHSKSQILILPYDHFVKLIKIKVGIGQLL
jgi:hypothetical protein